MLRIALFPGTEHKRKKGWQSYESRPILNQFESGGRVYKCSKSRFILKKFEIKGSIDKYLESLFCPEQNKS